MFSANDDFICDFCNLEFPNSSARNEHTLQHFRQVVCSGCGEMLICIGDVWYGPHTASNCCMANTEAVSEVEECDEPLPDCIEVKQEEIVDIDDEDEQSDYISEEISISGVLAGYESAEHDTNAETDNEQTNEEQYQMPNISNQNKFITDHETKAESNGKYFRIVNKKFKVDLSNCKMTPIHHKNKCIGFKSEPRETKSKESPQRRKFKQTSQRREVVVNEKEEENVGPIIETESLDGKVVVTPGLTEDQLNRRQCPICLKVIINKQNLICHMNIHYDVKPFACSVCQKSFAHIRNLNRHKEQQRHSEFLFKCDVQGCKKRFMSSNKMNRHVRIDHESQAVIVSQKLTHECQYCKKGFLSIGYLRMHMKRAHQILQ